MTKVQEFQKEQDDKALHRRSAMEAWGRTWKGELVISLKTEHDAASGALCDALASLPKDFSSLTDEDQRAIDAVSTLTSSVIKLRGLMLELALHPTRPKASASSKPGAGRKARDPITEATLVSTDGSAPEANPTQEPDPEA
jgi:hypothetical protein